MKNTKTFLGIIVLISIIGFSITACNTENYNGVWEAEVQGAVVTLSITEPNWTLAIPILGFSERGTFSRNGRTAVLNINSGVEYGTATIVNRSTISVTLNQRTDFPGTYTFNKQ